MNGNTVSPASVLVNRHTATGRRWTAGAGDVHSLLAGRVSHGQFLSSISTGNSTADSDGADLLRSTASMIEEPRWRAVHPREHRFLLEIISLFAMVYEQKHASSTMSCAQNHGYRLPQKKIMVTSVLETNF